VQQNSAKVPTGYVDKIQGIFPPRATVLALIIAASCALPCGSHGGGTGDPGGGSYPAPVPFTVGARVEKLYYFPCADCHAYMAPDSEVRELEVEEGHPATLEHGKGLMWCFSCHDSLDYGRLRDLLAKPIDFDNGYQVCNGCHAQKYGDWTHGAHGKRVANWRGERQLYSCVECHNPHRPSILPRAPKPPPPIRAGLESMVPVEEDDDRNLHRPKWEQIHAR
jgi:hypothetical protein